MSEAISSEGIEIGVFDNNTVKDEAGNILYRIIDGDVFQILKYTDKDLKNMNKGGLICVGTFSNNKAVTNEGDLLFNVM